MEPKLLTADRFVDQKTGISYRYVHSDTEYFRPHYHDYYELFLLLEGEALHMINGEQLLLSPATLVLIRPFDIHDYLTANEKPFSMLNITFTRETVEQLFSYLGSGFHAERLLSPALPPSVLLSESAFSYILTHMTEIRTIDREDSAHLRSALRILLFRVMTRFFSQNATQPKENVPEWLSRLCLTMQRDGNFTAGISRMIELSGKSREHLSRCMKQYYGMTLSQFVNDLRLRLIANMLRNSNHSIADIVFESGFGNLGWQPSFFGGNTA